MESHFQPEHIHSHTANTMLRAAEFSKQQLLQRQAETPDVRAQTRFTEKLQEINSAQEVIASFPHSVEAKSDPRSLISRQQQFLEGLQNAPTNPEVRSKIDDRLQALFTTDLFLSGANALINSPHFKQWEAIPQPTANFDILQYQTSLDIIRDLVRVRGQDISPENKLAQTKLYLQYDTLRRGALELAHHSSELNHTVAAPFVTELSALQSTTQDTVRVLQEQSTDPSNDAVLQEQQVLHTTTKKMYLEHGQRLYPEVSNDTLDIPMVLHRLEQALTKAQSADTIFTAVHTMYETYGHAVTETNNNKTQQKQIDTLVLELTQYLNETVLTIQNQWCDKERTQAGVNLLWQEVDNLNRELYRLQLLRDMLSSDDVATERTVEQGSQPDWSELAYEYETTFAEYSAFFAQEEPFDIETALQFEQVANRCFALDETLSSKKNEFSQQDLLPQHQAMLAEIRLLAQQNNTETAWKKIDQIDAEKNEKMKQLQSVRNPAVALRQEWFSLSLLQQQAHELLAQSPTAQETNHPGERTFGEMSERVALIQKCVESFSAAITTQCDTKSCSMMVTELNALSTRLATATLAYQFEKELRQLSQIVQNAELPDTISPDWIKLLERNQTTYYELRDQITTRERFRMNETTDIELIAYGLAEKGAVVDIILHKNDGTSVPLKQFAPPDTFFASDVVDLGERKPGFAANMNERQVLLPLTIPKVRQDFQKFIFIVLHEIGHLHQAEMKQENDGALTEEGMKDPATWEGRARLERNAWARALDYALQLQQNYDIDILAQFGSARKVRHHINTALGSYQLSAIMNNPDKDRVKKLFVKGKIPPEALALFLGDEVGEFEID